MIAICYNISMLREDRICKHHGTTSFYKSGTSSWHCMKCNVIAVSKRRRLVVDTIKKEHGGKCNRCGYDRCLAALDFHHLDPAQKEHGVGIGDTRSIAKMRTEAAKCLLVCANCHREIHFELKYVL